MNVEGLIAELKIRSEAADDKHLKRAFHLAARYLEVLLQAGEFSDDPRYFSPGTHWEEF